MGKEQDSTYYNEIYNSSEKYYRDANDIPIYFEIWNAARSYIDINAIKNIVDLGCGPGHFPSILNDDVSYIGYDFSEIAIKQARSRNINMTNVKFIHCNLDMYKHDNTCKFYTSFEFLEHISFDLELIESLNTGDSIVFSVPNHDAAGHVRFFLSENDIELRYGDLLNLSHLHTVTYGSNKIFLYHGERK